MALCPSSFSRNATPNPTSPSRGVHHDMARTTPERFVEAFVTELQAVVGCIAHDTKLPVTGHDSGATVAVGIAAAQSMHANRLVDIT